MIDLAIVDATIVDGTGAPGRVGTVLVRGDRIVDVVDGVTSGIASAVTIQGAGSIVAPGFIDVHNHSDLVPLIEPAMPSALRQGVTTIVVGNCGYSGWPPADEDTLRSWAGIDDPSMIPPIRSFGSWLDVLDGIVPSVNVAALVGHGTIRRSVMGIARRAPDRAAREAMRRLVAAAMDDGALGLSTGLVYVPGIHAKTDELADLARVASEAGGIYATHVRGEGERVFTAVGEALSVGRVAEIPVHVSHLKLESSRVWGRADELLALIERSGDATADQYPYTAWESELATLLPPWAPVEELPTLVADRATRARLLRSIEEGEEGDAGNFQSSVDGVGWEAIVIESTADTTCRGRSIASIADDRGVDPVEACLQLLVEQPATTCIGHAMLADDVDTIMAHPDVMVASDASAMAADGPFALLPVHPRFYGTFPRVLAAARDGLIEIEAAIRKMTSLPARRFGLSDRGEVKLGAMADLVLFDPATVQDLSTYDRPHRYPSGIRAVVVSGRVAWSATSPSRIDRAGRVVRRTG